MNRPKYLDSQYAALRTLAARGLSLLEIACELGMTYSAVQHYAYRNNIPHRRKSGKRKPDPTPHEIAARAMMVRMKRQVPPVETTFDRPTVRMRMR